MPTFNITRLHTKLGIFRLKGIQGSVQLERITITEIEILGSDGWVILDLNNNKIINLITGLHNEIMLHLGVIKSTKNPNL